MAASLSSPREVIVTLVMVVAMFLFLYYHSQQHSTIYDYRSQQCPFDALLKNQYLMAHNAEHQRVTAIHHTLVQNADVDVFIPILAYDWPSISELLDHGVCGIEFDLHPKENTYFPIRHINIYDDKSSCDTLSQCLREISDWMIHYATHNKHKHHCPIYIELDVKFMDRWTHQTFMEISQIVADSFSSILSLCTCPDLYIIKNILNRKPT
eukprot:428079_1